MPGLRNIAYLEIDLEDSDGNVHTGVFELHEELSETSDITITYLLSNRGQYLREAFDIGTDLLPEEVSDADLERRKGYHVDGGAGLFGQTVSARAFQGDTWGDGSTDPDNPDDVTLYDATGGDATSMKAVLEWYVSQPRQGSTGAARLYIGEWSDGTYADTPGIHDSPMYVAIQEASISKDPDEPGRLEVTLELVWTSLFPDAIGDTLDNVANWLEDI